MVREQIKNIGKVGTIQASGLTVKVKVLDVKQSYGKTRWLITPVSGEGEVWAENVSIAS